MARGGAALSVGASGARYAGDGGAAFSPAGPEGTGDPASIRPACADACRKCGTSPTRLTPTPSTVVLCKSSSPPRPLGIVAVQHQCFEEYQPGRPAHRERADPPPPKEQQPRQLSGALARASYKARVGQ